MFRLESFNYFINSLSICVVKTENNYSKQSYSLGKIFKSRKNEANWSLFYPDQKSDIYNEIDFYFKSRRIQEKNKF